ncbi:hypothetical protein GWI33_008439 [Rhynchophorus ferrugineus]|uniref:Uncharacterized protein n=1 Tax=Rhynchophorus ferrugineus TaxID=354439 RepID=A0A834ME53_RHYFE|nr:hypothetical protein GWI33_008439 [Rhynchophorus ferrugineus]
MDTSIDLAEVVNMTKCPIVFSLMECIDSNVGYTTQLEKFIHDNIPTYDIECQTDPGMGRKESAAQIEVTGESLKKLVDPRELRSYDEMVEVNGEQ